MRQRPSKVTPVLILVSVCMLRCAASAQTLQAKIDQLASAYARLDRFSGAVLVARDGKVIFAKGYGMANQDFNIPNTVKTNCKSQCQRK
jgi:CubicO group peptidase (beta-lactamase class C family)